MAKLSLRDRVRRRKKGAALGVARHPSV